VAAAKELGIPDSRLFVLNFHGEEVPEAYQSWTKLLECGERDWDTDLDASKTTAAYVSTSGTSGLPKAAILTHSYMVSQAEIIGRVTGGSEKVRLLQFPKIGKLSANCIDTATCRHTPIPRLYRSVATWCSTEAGYTMLYNAPI